MDPENTREWAALAAGSSTALSETNVNGLAAYIWLGTNQQPAVQETMTHFAQYAWQPEWALIRNWELSERAGAPGGDDTSTWIASGGAFFQNSPQAWPLEGQRLGFTTGLSWTGDSTPLEDQNAWLEVDGSQAPWAETLLRFYARFPQTSCSVSASMRYSYYDGTPDVVVAGTPAQTLSSTNAQRDDIWSFQFAIPTATPDTAMPTLTVSECGCVTDGEDQVCPYLDSISLYQGTPHMNFPVNSVPRAAADWSFVATKVCKDAAGGCMNEHTFPSP